MNDADYMARALEISLLGRPSPNPYVGAVVARDGKVIGEGYHKACGKPHAEVEALSGVDGEGATMYVTLEPCSHHGRTPPCTDAILEAGISEVVYSLDDPTDKVDGGRVLEEAGVKVRKGILHDECMRANEAFLKHSLTGCPFVTLKAAMTLDGQVATASGQSKWITSEGARATGRMLRARNDAVLVGVGTVLADDPLLTTRVEGEPDPVKIVLDSRLRTPNDARVFDSGDVIIATTEDNPRQGDYPSNAEILRCGRGRVDLNELMAALGGRGITSVLIEGGGTVNYSALKSGIIDKYMLFIAPKILGRGKHAFDGASPNELSEAVQLRFHNAARVDEDMQFEAYPIQ